MKAASLFHSTVIVLLVLLSSCCYWAIAYHIPRTSFTHLIIAVAILFVIYLAAISKKISERYLFPLLIVAFIFRLIFIVALPALSDDYFRFLWDGMLTDSGNNPYVYRPAHFLDTSGTMPPALLKTLLQSMNSAGYYSVYPPVLQFVFWLGAKVCGYQVLHFAIAMRAMVILAEMGTVFTIIKILRHKRLPVGRVLLYALNPLVIIEFSGNLHGESFMIFFLAGCYYFLIRQKLTASALFFGMAVAAKLLPLLFIPVLFVHLGKKKSLQFGFIVCLTVLITFLPFLNYSLVLHIASSIGLYFNRFEFNASIYYLLRWIGYRITGLNTIVVIGKILPLYALYSIVKIARRQSFINAERLFEIMLITMLIHFSFSLVVHPWYITTLVFLSVFTRYRFAIVWSALIMLTYSTYLQKPYIEILWLTACEYLLLAGYLVWEFNIFNATKNASASRQPYF